MENIVDKLTNYKYSLKEKIIGLKSKSISGANAISLNDASGNNAIAFGIKGNSIQETRSGKNKLPNIADITREFFGVTVSAINNEITVTGTATSGGGRLNSLLYLSLPAGSYKLGLTNNVQSRLHLSNTSTGTSIVNTNGDYINFTLTEETQLTLGVNVATDVTYNEKFKAMIVPSDVTDYTYEPYGAMPSPEFPSEIENVSGENLYDNDGVVATSDASITKSSTGFTATRTSSSTGDLFVASYEKQLKPNTKYTFCENRTNSATCYFYSDNLFGTALTRNLIKGTDDLIIYTFITDSTGKVVIGFYSANQKQGDTITLSNIMLLEGEYTPTNIPRYIQHNSIVFKSVGKNLLKHYYNKGFSYTTNGITFTINEDYSVTINGTATDTAFLNLNNVEGYYIPISEGKTYTAYTGVDKFGLSLVLTTLDNTSLIYLSNTSQKTYISTYTGNTRIYLRVASGYAFENLTVYPMLIEGTEITSYEPYKESIVTFPLTEGQKLYKDTYLADDGIHHKRKQRVLNGSEGGWYEAPNQAGENTKLYIINISGQSTKYGENIVPTISDRFTCVKSVWSPSSNVGLMLQSNNGALMIRINSTLAPTLSDFKTWLASNPITVEYELAEEEIVPYTEEQEEAYNRLKTFAMHKGVNNIEVSSNIEASETSIEYYSDEVVSLDNYKFEVKEI